MAWIDRDGNPVPGDEGQDKMLAWLYGTGPGHGIVKLLIKPWVSRCAGKLMDSGISRLAIKPFLKRNRINMEEYEEGPFPSFNAFFTRQIRPGKRPIDPDPAHFIAPCDSKLSVYPITADATFRVKQTEYTLESLLRDKELTRKYEGGLFLLFRLTVGDYHRYGYVESGQKGENRKIPGVFHTVNPAANDRYPIYKENTREFTVIETDRCGAVLQMEVGATMVGRIVNYHGARQVNRGEEKGKFEFGGSTVIVCLEKDRAVIDPDILKNTANGLETVVKFGEKIGICN